MGDRSVRIFDLSLWLDESILHERSCFGKTASEFLELIDLFTCDSDDLRVFLPFFSDNDLRLILEKHPALQRILPERFALDNINLLSEEYDFPSISACKSYYVSLIKNTLSTKEYKRLADLFNNTIARASNSTDKITVLSLNIDDINDLQSALESVYSYTIYPNQKRLYGEMCFSNAVGDERFESLLLSGEKEYLIDLGLFIDCFSDALHIDHKFSTIAEYYEHLQDIDKQQLSHIIKTEAAKELNSFASASNPQVGRFSFFIEQYGQYLDHQTITKAIDVLNPILANCIDVDDILIAFDENYISEEQYSKRIIELTADYSSNALKELIEKSSFKNPHSVQEYFIKAIIERSSYSFRCDGARLITWFVEQACDWNRFDLPLILTVLETVVSDISEDDWWDLFRDKTIPLLPKHLIRKTLDEAYCDQNLRMPYFQKDCFQEAMVEDVLSMDCTSETMFLILANLKSEKLYQVYSKGNEMISFFAWAYLPSEDIIHEEINWTSLSHYFSLLPPERQLRVFKFLLYLKAKKYESYTLQELVSQLSNGSNEVCHALQALIHILLDLSESLDSIITSRDIKSFFFFVSERELGACALFASLFKFCNGRHLLSKYEKSGGGAFGRIKKKEKNNAPFFVITFYEDKYNEYIDYSDEDPGLNRCVEMVFERNFRNQKTIKKKDQIEHGVPSDELLRIKEFAFLYRLDNSDCLFEDNQSGLTEDRYLKDGEIYISKRPKYLCDCNICKESDPEFGLPFYWCKQQPCVHYGDFFTWVDNWEHYRFVDIVSVLKDFDHNLDDSIWAINSEISRLINHIVYHLNSIEANETETGSNQMRQEIQSEVGVWTDGMSIVSQLEEHYDDFDENEYNEDPRYSRGHRSFQKYRGSYAQDEAGYSDDEIDDIFDGDPSAYWNID